MTIEAIEVLDSIYKAICMHIDALKEYGEKNPSIDKINLLTEEIGMRTCLSIVLEKKVRLLNK